MNKNVSIVRYFIMKFFAQFELLHSCDTQLFKVFVKYILIIL